jgi:hypothetical protein
MIDSKYLEPILSPETMQSVSRNQAIRTLKPCTVSPKTMQSVSRNHTG